MLANIIVAGALIVTAGFVLAYGGVWGIAFLFLALASMVGGVANA